MAAVMMFTHSKVLEATSLPGPKEEMQDSCDQWEHGSDG